MNTILLLVNLATLAVLGFTLRVYYGQLQTMQRELSIARYSADGQNTLSLIAFLQDQSVRDARKHVREHLRHKPLEYWDDRDRHEAGTVCSTFDVLGMMIEHKLVPEEIFLASWGPTVLDCHEILASFLEDLRVKQMYGPQYWAKFTRLCAAVREYRDAGRAD